MSCTIASQSLTGSHCNQVKSMFFSTEKLFLHNLLLDLYTGDELQISRYVQNDEEIAGKALRGTSFQSRISMNSLIRRQYDRVLLQELKPDVCLMLLANASNMK